ncbi:MAG: hypothetical protein IPM93_18310 [Candidatus Obscuribacter sp.]|nr:hypothetical protein [Candidatus Obscuribacter sp.]
MEKTEDAGDEQEGTDYNETEGGAPRLSNSLLLLPLVLLHPLVLPPPLVPLVLLVPLVRHVLFD